MAQVSHSPDPVPFLEVRLVATDGRVLDVEVWLAAIVYRGRDAILITGRDRSAARRDAARLRESEEALRDLYEEAPIAYVKEDLESRFLSANTEPEILRRIGNRADGEIVKPF